MRTIQNFSVCIFFSQSCLLAFQVDILYQNHMYKYWMAKILKKIYTSSPSPQLHTPLCHVKETDQPWASIINIVDYISFTCIIHFFHRGQLSVSFFCTVVYFSMHFWPPLWEWSFWVHFLPVVMILFLVVDVCSLPLCQTLLIDIHVVFPRVPVFLYESCCPIDAFSVERSRALVVEFSCTIQIYHYFVFLHS